MKKIITIIMFCLCGFLYAEDANADKAESDEKPQTQNHIISLAGIEYLQTDEDQALLSPSAGLQFMRIMPQTGLFTLAANYSLDYYKAGFGADSVKDFHGISLMGNYNAGKNTFMAMLASQGQQPFSDWKTLTGVFLYNRQLVKNDSFSFILGGGLVIGAFDLKIKDFEVFVLPLPVFSLTYNNYWFKGSLAFMGAPSLQVTLFPSSFLRFDGSLSLTGIDSARNIAFDCALKCYPFVNKSLGEALSFSAGLKRAEKTCRLKNKDEYKFNYLSAYGEINATFISLRCGYNFDGVKLVNKEVTGPLYNGIFASANAMLFF